MQPSITDYQVSAALWVVRAVDERGGTDSVALNLAFRNAVTQGRFPQPDLDNALALLADFRLVHVVDGRAFRDKALAELVALPNDTAMPLLARLLASTTDLGDLDDADSEREIIGTLGEEAVTAWCVEELSALGHHELVPQVRRVSLVSDRFGYDVSAPTIGAGARMLEVKTSKGTSGSTFRFFLTRNEYEVARRNPRRWALVACTSNGETASVLGWCRGSELERYLPDDGNGRWTEALVNLPRRALLSSVPSALL